MQPPPLSIVIPTRNRPESAADCVSRVLASEPGEFELILVDQSDGPETKNALASAVSDARFHYLQSTTRGAAAARNVGIEQARGDVIAFTDDDCRVAADWIRGIRQLFASKPEIDVMFGRVTVPPGPPGAWAPGFAASSNHQQRYGYPAFPGGWGMSANLACRRAVLERTGGFDPLLGPGSPLKAAEDFDLFIRMRKAGLKIVNVEEVAVDHVGFREERELQTLICGYNFSTGATLMKHVRMGEVALLAVLARHGAKLLARGCKRVLLFQGFGAIRELGCLVRGACASFRYRIDRERQLYLQRPRALYGGA